MTEEKKPPTEWEKFDKVMGGLLAVPYKELQVELEKDRKKKAAKKKRSKKPASRASDA
jgi:hypothetical protein